MYILYNLAIYITSPFLHIIAFFNTKVNLFINGRKNVFTELQKHITDKDSTIWIHAASLGEFEQGLPIVEKLKAESQSLNLLVEVPDIELGFNLPETEIADPEIITISLLPYQILN